MTKMKTITSIVFIISFSILSFSQGNRDKIKREMNIVWRMSKGLRKDYNLEIVLE